MGGVERDGKEKNEDREGNIVCNNSFKRGEGEVPGWYSAAKHREGGFLRATEKSLSRQPITTADVRVCWHWALVEKRHRKRNEQNVKSSSIVKIWQWKEERRRQKQLASYSLQRSLSKHVAVLPAGWIQSPSLPRSFFLGQIHNKRRW